MSPINLILELLMERHWLQITQWHLTAKSPGKAEAINTAHPQVHLYSLTIYGSQYPFKGPVLNKMTIIIR